jgi:hypothetical protein
MRKLAAIAIALCAASGTVASAEPMVRHAGEWESTINNGKPNVFCVPNDETFDQNYVTKTMSKLPGASCTMSNWSAAGGVITYSLQCTVGGSTMTSSGTTTVTGPDAYTTKSHSHGGAIKMPDGKTVEMQDMDMTVVSRRLGPCKPGDRQINH